MSRRPRQRARRARSTHRPRAGFTLLEVLVAALVLLTGLVGVATATAAALRSLADARLEEDAATLAGRRVELLRGLPCALRRSGVDTAGLLVERWEVGEHAAGAATRLTVTVAPVARPTRARRYETVAPC
jgi:prepilin-type N-terminal cleavage/methylation domain-containing protein